MLWKTHYSLPASGGDQNRALTRVNDNNIIALVSNNIIIIAH